MSGIGDREVVRPTRRALSDLGIAVPPIDVLLHEHHNRHIQEMQKTPERLSAGGAERIVSIADRVWFKYKSSDMRAAVGKLRESEVFTGAHTMQWLARWWIVAAGHRSADSPQSDFYARLSSEVTNNGGSSDCLLPSEWDEKRLKAELGVLFVVRIQASVRAVIRAALQADRPIQAVAANHYLQAQITHGDELYLSLGTGGVYDSKVVAVILDSIPGVAQDDWFIEPSPQLEFEPEAGEIVWSTVLPEDSLTALMTEEP